MFSSRKLERATYDSVAFRFIAANQHPEHDTIATFRRRFLPEVAPAEATAAITALHEAVSSSDSDAFEQAVCAMFGLFGFAATHVGGDGAPDGYADALIGELRYRVMIECKLSPDHNVAHTNAAVEAGKYRDVYRGTYCVLVALSFYAEATFGSELHTHGVAAWSVDDLFRAQ